MLEMTEENGLVRIRVQGTLEASDYHRFVPQLERIASRETGTVPMVIELAPDFSGWDVGGLWHDLKFDVKHKDSFDRNAIVGDSKWEECGTKAFDPLFTADMKFFQPAERDAAESWARAEGNAA